MSIASQEQLEEGVQDLATLIREMKDSEKDVKDGRKRFFIQLFNPEKEIGRRLLKIKYTSRDWILSGLNQPELIVFILGRSGQVSQLKNGFSFIRIPENFTVSFRTGVKPIHINQCNFAAG